MLEGEKQQLISGHEKVDEDGSGTLAENLSNPTIGLKLKIRQQILTLGNPGDEDSINRVFNAYLIAFRQNGESEETVLSNVSYFLQSKISIKHQKP